MFLYLPEASLTVVKVHVRMCVSSALLFVDVAAFVVCCFLVRRYLCVDCGVCVCVCVFSILLFVWMSMCIWFVMLS